MKNYFMYFGFTTEMVLILVLEFFLPINYVFRTTDVTDTHFGMIAAPFACLSIFWNEIRKSLILYYPAEKKGMPNWWARCSLY